MVAGGLVEGTALGVAQGRLLRRRFPALRQGRYLAATVLVAGLGWAAGSAPATVAGAGEPEGGAGEPALVLVLLGAAALGLAMGSLLGAAQALAMRHDVPHPWRWVGANVLAWPGAMVVIFVGATSAGPGWSDAQVVVLGTATGAAAGALLGIVLGALAQSSRTPGTSACRVRAAGRRVPFRAGLRPGPRAVPAERRRPMASTPGIGRLTVLRDTIRTQMWPLPTLAVVLAVAVGVGLPYLDARIDADIPPTLKVYLFGGGAEAARTVLGAVASSLITVTALTFSLTVVTLQLASSQFSPRLLRTFTRDRFVHVTLALFLGTFTYSLTVLRTIRAAGESRDVFVPQISVTVGFALALASVLALVLFLAHLVRQIRVETMLRRVHEDSDAAMLRLLDEREAGGPDRDVPEPPDDAEYLPTRSSGFLVQVDEDALLRAAVEAGAVVLLDRGPGSSLVAGSPVGLAWAAAGTLGSDALERLRETVASAVLTGFERTDTQDYGYGVRQLTDVTNKALSPGINDPTTAIHALGHCSALLCDLAARDLGPRVLRDPDGEVRVVIRRPDLADLLELAVTQPRRYGAGDPFVLGRLFGLLRELAWCVQLDGHRRAVRDQLARLRETAAAQDFDATEGTRLAELGDLVEHSLDGRWRSVPDAW